MIKEIVVLLGTNDWFGIDEDIDIAKGKYELPETWKEFKDNRKRWQRKD